MQITNNRQTPSHVLELFVDGHCKYCIRFARLLRRLDRRERLRVYSFRDQQQHETRGLEFEAVERRMHAYSLRDGAVSSGFAALRLICRTLPALWPLLLPLWILAVLGLGDRLYDLLARHRVISPPPGACDLTTCQIESSGRDRSSLRRHGLTATAALLGTILVAHFAATLVHIMPLTSVGVMFSGLVSGYMHPIFSQRWSLFAPEPPLQDSRLNVQCRSKDGKETVWLDTDSDLRRHHARYRFTPSSYLLRVNRAALAGAVGVQDDEIDELMNKLDRLSIEERKLLKESLRDRALARINDQRFLYRLLEHYCGQISRGGVTATRARIIFETIPKFSKRNDPRADLNTRELTFDWVPRGGIDQYVATKRLDIQKAFDQVSLEDLKKLKTL